jgi:EAL domain-containing protein (putative c-di-GMP-specific phosphodiesterase class I)
MHFQPLVDLAAGSVVAYEALARFQGHPDLTPDGWFRMASRHGLREQLELAALGCGLRALDDLRDEVAVCVNLSSVGMLSSSLARRLEGLPPDRIVLELTEQEAVSDYRALNRALLRYRADGVRLAVDDAGAGFASMKHIVDLQPDIIKLDASWVTDIEADPVRRAMVASLASFAHSIDAVMVGEAVETNVQAEVLRDIGVPWAQGYFFAHPAPLAG